MLSEYKKRRIIFVSSVLAISIVALIFIVVNFRNEIIFFYSPQELFQANIKPQTEVRVGGLVLEKTVKKIDALTTEFVITDMNQKLRVTYLGLLPDLFREKQGVVAKGIFDKKNNVFIAKELLVKHDEKYMPPEVARGFRPSSKLAL